MNKAKFSEILLYKEKLIALYKDHDVDLHPNSRLMEYFKYLNELEDTRTKYPTKLESLIRSNPSIYYMSLLYCNEVYFFIRALEIRPQNKDILRNKLKHYAKGTYLLSNENNTNSLARNTSFELSLFAYLVGKGVDDVSIHEPNPDIYINRIRYRYFVECKRIFSTTKLQQNIVKSIEQLQKMPQSVNNINAVALSLDQVFFNKNDIILDAVNENSALKAMDNKISRFRKEFATIINSTYSSMPVLFIYYFSCLTGFSTDLPISTITFLAIDPVRFGPHVANSINSDFKILGPSFR